MTDEERLHFLAGQVAALETVIKALIGSHASPAALLAEIESLGELQTVASLPEPVSDSYIDGMDSTASALRGAAKEALSKAP